MSTFTRRSLLVGGFTLATAGYAAAQTNPSTARRPAGRAEAHIGFGMWLGRPEVTFGENVDVTRGSRRIHGPLSWQHPITGERLTIYVRVNRERDGERVQYLTMRPDGVALARVYDSRPGRTDRVFVGDAFFPLGLWRRGESRAFQMTEYADGPASQRRLTLTVIDPSREFRGVPGSMRYDWIARNRVGGVVFHERFDYSPGIGFVRFDNRLSSPVGRDPGEMGRAAR